MSSSTFNLFSNSSASQEKDTSAAMVGSVSESSAFSLSGTVAESSNRVSLVSKVVSKSSIVLSRALITVSTSESESSVFNVTS